MPPSKWLVFIRPSLAGFDRPLTDWEKQWNKKTVASGQCSVASGAKAETGLEMPKLVAVDFQTQCQRTDLADSHVETPVGAVARAL